MEYASKQRVIKLEGETRYGICCDIIHRDKFFLCVSSSGPEGKKDFIFLRVN